LEYKLTKETSKTYVQKELEEFCNMLLTCVKEYSIDYMYEKEVHNRYDKGYKYLLSIKKNFMEFMKIFVKVSWDEEITEEDIELMDKEFITVDFEKRESDLIYRIKKGEKEAYFLLLEIQSKVDRKMAYRLINYIVEIWRKCEKKKGKFTLPKVIPCVLYNGKRSWNVPLELRELYEDIEEYNEYLVNFKYILIDIHRYDPKYLLECGNVISSAFYFDSSKKENLEERLKNLTKSLAKADRETIKDFKRWIANVFSLSEEENTEVEKKFMREEVEMTDLQKVIREWRRDAEIAGRKEGMKQGELNSKVSSLIHILTKKLKESPSQEIISKLKKLTLEELIDIEDRIFDIVSWDEI